MLIDYKLISLPSSHFLACIAMSFPTTPTPVTPNQQLDYIKIVKEGTYFNWPENRYYPGVVIVCDRCQKSNIYKGFGLGNNDLCMECVHKINAQYNVVDGKKLNHNIIMNTTLMMQKQYSPTSTHATFQPSQPEITRMLQHQYQPSIHTNMELEQYKPSQQQQLDDESGYVTKMAMVQFRPGNSPLTFMMQQQYQSRVGNFDNITPYDTSGKTNHGYPLN